MNDKHTIEDTLLHPGCDKVVETSDILEAVDILTELTYVEYDLNHISDMIVALDEWDVLTDEDRKRLYECDNILKEVRKNVGEMADSVRDLIVFGGLKNDGTN